MASVERIWIDPIFVFGIEFDVGEGVELGFVEWGEVRFGCAKGLEMGFGFFEAPVIGVGRAIAPGGFVGCFGGEGGGGLVAFCSLNVGEDVVGIGLTHGIGAAFCGVPDFVESGSGRSEMVLLEFKFCDSDECWKLELHDVDGSRPREGVV